MAAKTQIVYADLWDRHVLPRLGGLQLRRITPEVVDRYQASLRDAGLGDPTIIKTLTLLQGVLKRAVIWGRIPSNPVASITKPPQQRTRSITPPAPSEVEAMRLYLRLSGRPADAALITLMACAGLRPGEALGLEWPNVRVRTLVIEQAISLGDIKETKTRRVRAVRLLAPLASDLFDWRQASASDDLVFPRAGGAPWSDHDYRNWRKRTFRAAANSAGRADLRPYDLRHTFVSLLLAEGRGIVDVAGQAGHAPSMSFDTYGHLIAELDETRRRPATEVILEAREAGVRMVCDLPALRSEGSALDDLESAPFAGLSFEALSGDRTQDPLLTIEVPDGVDEDKADAARPKKARKRPGSS